MARVNNKKEIGKSKKKKDYENENILNLIILKLI